MADIASDMFYRMFPRSIISVIAIYSPQVIWSPNLPGGYWLFSTAVSFKHLFCKYLERQSSQ